MARPKPPVASWIVRERKRLGLKPADLVMRLAAQGITVSEQTIRVWESNAGRNPSAENREALARIFGSQAPLEATESGDSSQAVAEAIREQTAAIVAAIAARDQVLEHLLSELAKYREAQLDVLNALKDAGHPVAPMPEDEPAPALHGPAPRRSGRA